MTRDTETIKYRSWRKKVFKRDKYTCQKCGAKQNLEAHHVLSWNCNIHDRYNPSNGVTLCTSKNKDGSGCHDKFHQKYGKGDNTLKQLEAFIGKVKNINQSRKFFGRVKKLINHDLDF